MAAQLHEQSQACMQVIRTHIISIYLASVVGVNIINKLYKSPHHPFQKPSPPRLVVVVRRAAVLLGRLRVRRRWRDVRRRRRAVGLLARRWVARLVAHDRWVASVDQISCKNSNELAVCAAATACVDEWMDWTDDDLEIPHYSFLFICI